MAEIRSFGGVRFNTDNVAATKTVIENGKTMYIIEFKSGATAKYPAQAEKDQSTINCFRKNKEFEDYSKDVYNINRIFGLEFTDTAEREEIVILEGCNNCHVDTGTRRKGRDEKILIDEIIIKKDADTGTIYQKGEHMVSTNGFDILILENDND